MLFRSARKAALGLIQEWNDYLSGNVYGYVVEDERGEHLDSCWGFYGDYNADGGCLSEARTAAKVHNSKAEKAKRAIEYRERDIREAERLIASYGYILTKKTT